MSQARHLPAQQYFQGDTLSRQAWVFSQFIVRTNDKSSKAKARKVGVLCPIPAATILGVGAYEDESSEKVKLPGYEIWLQNTINPKSVPESEIVDFFFSIGNNMQSGVTVLDALNRSLGSVQSPYFRGVIACLMFYIKSVDGTLSKAMAHFPAAFDGLTVGLLIAGEESGTVRESMLRIYDMRKANLKLVGKVKSACAYPFTVAILIFIAMNGIGLVIIPKLMPVFTQMMPNGLPASTQLVFDISSIMKRFWWLTPVGIFGLFYSWKHKQALFGRKWFQRGVVKMPGFGRVVFLFILIRTMRIFAQMLRAGVPPQRVYETAGRVAGNVIFIDYFNAVYARLRSGKDPHPAFFAERWRLGDVGVDIAQAMRLGAVTNDYSAAIEQRVCIYEDELNAVLEKLPNYINMSMMLIIAPALILVALAVIEPSLKMGQDTMGVSQKTVEISSKR